MRTIAGHADQSHAKLLVVDDDQVQRTIIAKIGARLGYVTRNGRAMDILLGLRIKVSAQRSTISVQGFHLSPRSLRQPCFPCRTGSAGFVTPSSPVSVKIVSSAFCGPK